MNWIGFFWLLQLNMSPSKNAIPWTIMLWFTAIHIWTVYTYLWTKKTFELRFGSGDSGSYFKGITLNLSFSCITLIISHSIPLICSQFSFTYGSKTRAQNLKVQFGSVSGTFEETAHNFVIASFFKVPFSHLSKKIGFSDPWIVLYYSSYSFDYRKRKKFTHRTLHHFGMDS